jgi:hypothetical protein
VKLACITRLYVYNHVAYMSCKWDGALRYWATSQGPKLDYLLPVISGADMKYSTGVFTAEGSYLYWPSSNGISRKPIAGGAVESFPINVTLAADLHVEGNYAYFVGDASLGRVELTAGAQPESIVTGSWNVAVPPLTTSPAFLYWQDNGALLRLPN